MNVAGKVVAVTGGGSGIGAAMARRFAADGASAVVVADLDARAAAAVAAEIGGDGRELDVAEPHAVAEFVGAVERRHGGIDLFCSNAGFATGAGLGAPMDTWRRAFDVHVLAHVWAARAVLPGMLQRGHGYLVNTASAAGLLTSPGDAPYTASKHAAVGLAEWLAVTYGARGIGVSVVCPRGVATPLLLDPLAAGDPAAAAVAASGEILPPEAVADAVAAGVAAERFLIVPQPEVARFWAQKASDPDRWLAGVRRMLSR
jgi:NAD(P)-dependent dehydrogenase (short-subunit alcohol dehydrogenase family)